MRFWLLITEEELYEWSQCFCWHLPQKPLSVRCNARSAAVAVRRRMESLHVKDEDELMIAEFDCSGRGEALKQVPFFSVDVLYGLTPQRKSILEDRYASFGLKIRQFDEARAAVCRNEIAALGAIREASDIRLGGMAMLEMMQVTACQEFERFVDEATRAIGGEGSTLLSDIFAYSRGEPWACDGMLAGLCDLGRILRGRMSGPSVDVLQNLSMRVADSLRRGERSCYLSIDKLLAGLNRKEGFDPSLVLFLSWKYAAERQGGRMDFDCVARDVEDAGAGEVSARALCLFGAFSGFSSIADIYHQRMREMLRNSGVASSRKI